jgi:glutaredoxin
MLLFQKPGCPHCARARKCLKKNGVKFTSVNCKDAEELVAKIKAAGLRVPTTKTFPRVYDGKKLIGGADDVEKKYGRA